ncbi:MAG: hypothetical protein Q4D13_02840 [Erysipelotrichaceae bacterium]|nr:hypothetical protein [Erysipelotrichaceae bacterium]
MSKKEMTPEEVQEYLKEGLESGRIRKGGFIEEALSFQIDYLKEKKKENQ